MAQVKLKYIHDRLGLAQHTFKNSYARWVRSQGCHSFILNASTLCRPTANITSKLAETIKANGFVSQSWLTFNYQLDSPCTGFDEAKVPPCLRHCGRPMASQENHQNIFFVNSLHSEPNLPKAVPHFWITWINRSVSVTRIRVQSGAAIVQGWCLSLITFLHPRPFSGPILR